MHNHKITRCHVVCLTLLVAVYFSVAADGNVLKLDKDFLRQRLNFSPNAAANEKQELHYEAVLNQLQTVRNGITDNTTDSSDNDDPITLPAAATTSCCLPTIWQGRVSKVEDDGSGVEALFSIDRSMQRTRIDMVITNTNDAITQIVVYPNSTTGNDTVDSVPADVYTIDNSTGLCVHSLTSSDFPNLCLPDNARLVANITLGETIRTSSMKKMKLKEKQFAGREAMPVQLWTSVDPDSNRIDEFMVESVDCIPIFSWVYDSSGEDTDQPSLAESTLYSDIETGQVDQQVFQIPASCSKTVNG